MDTINLEDYLNNRQKTQEELQVEDWRKRTQEINMSGFCVDTSSLTKARNEYFRNFNKRIQEKSPPSKVFELVDEIIHNR